jgi:asparagine synthase (glutamine-hydrolysing)
MGGHSGLCTGAHPVCQWISISCNRLDVRFILIPQSEGKMDGIGGVCQHGARLNTQDIHSLLYRYTSPSDSITGRCAALATYGSTQFTSCDSQLDLFVASDADICNWPDLGHASLAYSRGISDLYRSLGPRLFRLFEGAFAIAIWDESTGRLVLATDPFGIKRIYWRHTARRIQFASSLKTLREHRVPEVRTAAVMEYLVYGAIPAPLTIDADIHRLAPGTILTWNGHSVRLDPYWDLEYSDKAALSSDAVCGEIRQNLRCAVRKRFHSAKASTTGAFLSGGLDSSSILAFMSEIAAPVKTFSVYSPEPTHDESAYARCASRAFQADSAEVVLTPHLAFAGLPRLMGQFDQPFGNSSAIAVSHCALLAHERGVSTLLAGDGGDEIFAGNQYSRARAIALYDQVPHWLRSVVVEPAAHLLARIPGLTLADRYVRRAGLPDPLRYLSYNPFLSAAPHDIFEPGFLDRVLVEEPLAVAVGHFTRASRWPWLDRLLYHDMKTVIGDNDLYKVTSASSLHGVNVRFPMLDRAVVNLGCHLPTRLKLHYFQQRYAYRRAMKSVLPAPILRKKKLGFGIPIGTWLTRDRNFHELMADILSSARTQQRGYFRRSFVQQLLCLHHSANSDYYGQFLWRLMALEFWHQLFGDVCAIPQTPQNAVFALKK